MLLDVASRRRDARRAAGRRARRRAACCTATTRASTSCATAIARGRASHRRRLLRRARPARRAARRAGCRCPTSLLRITPGVHAHTHEFIATGQDDSKFGFNLGNGDAERRRRAGDRVRQRRTWSGCTATSGRTCSPRRASRKAAEVMARFAVPLGSARARARRWARRRVRRRRGGADDHPVGAACCSTPARRSACASRVSVEPGRAIVAAAAITVYTVGTIKHIPGVRTYVAVDGGMSDNPRPVLYGSGYEAFLPAGGGRRTQRRGRGSSASTARAATC